MRTQRSWFLIAVAAGLIFVLVAGFLTMGSAFAQGPGWMMGGSGNNDGFGPYGMMGNTQGFSGTMPFGPGGMMNGGGMMGAPGWMMGNTQGFSGTMPFGSGGMMNGMMGQMMNGGMMGMMGHNMMINPNSPFYTAAAPLTLEETTTILEVYLTDLNDSNLAVDDVMIFDNHAYAQIVETDSGLGVMEVLVDPTTQAVYPEMGPTMMWNQKYGMMAGYGRYGMMGGFGNNMMGNFGSADVSAEMTLTPEQAVETAQAYLKTAFSETGLTADDHADPFYGYYTLHVNRDGETVGMLSVNGYSGQVFPHTWHGELLEMGGEAAHD